MKKINVKYEHGWGLDKLVATETADVFYELRWSTRAQAWYMKPIFKPRTRLVWSPF